MSTSLLGLASRICWIPSPTWKALAPAFHTFRSISSGIDKGADAESKATPDDGIATKETESEEALTKTEQDAGSRKPPEKPMKRRARFIKWLATEGSKFERPVHRGTNYLDKQGPFPMNPLFKPVPPIADYVREQIYAQYLENPVTIKTRELGVLYRISIKRVEAILKLKAHEKKLLSKGYVLQTNFTKNMESMLGVHEPSTEPEALTEFDLIAKKPTFKMVNEEVSISAKDAAGWLGRSPWAQVKEKIELVHSNFNLKEEVSISPAPIANPINKNVRSKRGFTFVFADTSKAALQYKYKGVVREPTGEVRPATALEMRRNRNARTFKNT